MNEVSTSDFIIAIGFTVAMISLVVGMFGFQLVISARRLRKTQRLADAALAATP